MKDIDLRALLKRVVELVMPDLRSYYRVIRKAKVIKSYAADGRYFADVQVLCNDNSVDEDEPFVPRVEIPVIWGGPDRGIVCPPLAGVHCDLEYYDGDPDFPRISNFRWYNMSAPAVEVGGFIIQHSAGAYIKIDAAKNILLVTPENITCQAGGTATIQAPQINIVGHLEVNGSINANDILEVSGDIHATGTIIDGAGNTANHEH